MSVNEDGRRENKINGRQMNKIRQKRTRTTKKRRKKRKPTNEIKIKPEKKGRKQKFLNIELKIYGLDKRGNKRKK